MKVDTVFSTYPLNLLTLCFFVMFLGCSDHSNKSSVSAAREGAVTPIAKNQADFTDIERKLIKEGRVVFETVDLKTTREKIIQVIENYHGYISSDREFESPGRFSNTIVIRVPASNFDTLLTETTNAVKKVDSKEVTAKDVTEEFLDIEARLKTKKELEKRYHDLLQEANQVSEILQIEKQIGELRSEIESIEGRFEYLQNQVSYSTLTITFYQRIPHQTKFGEKFTNGFTNGWNNLIWFFVMLVNIWPFIFISIILLLGIRWYKRRKKRS
ncbi:DUF4349 domain-containing protein [Membranihabitans maritimus]|uniref:DUF4349 domain-containing protein n=1 Tax=Membranihabitans maritimus TaxID=2904244 RepID=UPI001F21C747|nr:DUF4349 domain-containing protein [Membranihabitans maritimus]